MDSILIPRQPTSFELLFKDPVRTLAKSLYQLRQRHLVYDGHELTKSTVVCVSDTHNSLPDLPAGDILIHAGDLSQSGTRSEIQATLDWLARQNHAHKLVIAGNHELLLDPNHDLNKQEDRKKERLSLNWHDLIHLQDGETVLRLPGGRHLKVFGSPWTRKHGNWAFQYSPNADKWTNVVPEDTDILITHMPPFAHQDIDGWGDERLLQEVKRTQPRLHVFGHFHGGRGIDNVRFDKFNEAYENVLRRRNVVCNLLKMCYIWMLSFILANKQPITTMVNAAMIGVCRDRFKEDETLDAQVVLI